MDSLEKIIGTEKFRSLNTVDKSRINDLMVANPVYTFLIAGIMNDPEWRRILGAAYIRYVQPTGSVKAQTPKLKKPMDEAVVFGVGDVNEMTKTHLAI